MIKCHVNLKMFYTILHVLAFACGNEWLGQARTHSAKMYVHRQRISNLSTRNRPTHFDTCDIDNYSAFPFYKSQTESTSIIMHLNYCNDWFTLLMFYSQGHKFQQIILSAKISDWKVCNSKITPTSPDYLYYSLIPFQIRKFKLMISNSL
jgi:hypothetical protein